MSVRGGAIRPVKIVSSSELIENGGKFRLMGRTAMRVHGFTTADRTIKGGPATPVYVVSAEEVAAGDFTVEGGAAVPVIDIEAAGGDRVVQGNAAIPVYLSSGSLS